MLFGIYAALGKLKDQVEIGWPFKAVDGDRKEIFLYVRVSKYFDLFLFVFSEYGHAVKLKKTFTFMWNC